MRHKAVVQCARFSAYGRWILTASEDSTAQVWNAATGQPAGQPMRHRDWVVDAEFSVDGTRVATASRDGTARIWDARTGRPVSEPFMHEADVRTVRFSRDGRRILTACRSGKVHLWDIPPRPSSGAAGATLLADLAEAVIGHRVNEQGVLEGVSSAGLATIQRRVEDLPRDADINRWLEWFLADRSTRTISPNSSITVPDYVARLMEQRTLPAAREAVLLAPTNAVALAHLADLLLTNPGSNSSVTISEAHFLRSRATALAPRP
jgi:WD40 repeat protein